MWITAWSSKRIRNPRFNSCSDYLPDLKRVDPEFQFLSHAYKDIAEWSTSHQLGFLASLRPYNALSQTSPCNIKGLSVNEVLRIENMITQMKFYWYLNSFSPLRL